MIIKPSDLLNKMFAIREQGRPRQGVSTGYASIDELMLLNKRKLMVVTGIPGQGKSEFLDGLAMNTSLLHGWNWCYFNPEADPQEGDHMHNICMRKIGKRLVHATPQQIKDAVTWADNHYSWLNLENKKASIECILDAAATRIAMGEKIDVLCVDPWNELNHARQHNMRDDIYLGDCLSQVNEFKKEHDCLVIIVVHPRSVEKNKDGTYPTIHIRECNGGITWYAKADYGICVNRIHPVNHGIDVFVQKVKTKMIGHAGKATLDYDPISGRFKDVFENEYLLPFAVYDTCQLPFVPGECT